MDQYQQRQLDSLRRVQDFLATHAADIGALAESEGARQLDDAVTRLTAFGNEQGAANLQLVGQLSRQRALTVDLKASYMQPIATFARARLRDTPDFAALSSPKASLERSRLIGAARAMAIAAAGHADALTRGGFPADTITQLTTAADAVHDALMERANTKVRRVGATKGIETEILHGREAVSMLHAVISGQFARNATFLAAWRSARRVVGKPGLARGVAPQSIPALVPLSVMAVVAPVTVADTPMVAVAA